MESSGQFLIARDQMAAFLELTALRFSIASRLKFMRRLFLVSAMTSPFRHKRSHSLFAELSMPARIASAFLLILMSLENPAAAFEISPENPTVCDSLILVIHRSFADDCFWNVTSRVRLESDFIHVTLYLKGSDKCMYVQTDRSFELAIGSFPAGNYEVAVR